MSRRWYYEVISAELVPRTIAFAAETAQAEAARRLGAKASQVPIRWILPVSVRVSSAYGADPEYLTLPEPVEGVCILREEGDIAVYVRADLSPSDTGETVAHELRHWKQFRDGERERWGQTHEAQANDFGARVRAKTSVRSFLEGLDRIYRDSRRR